MRRVFEKSNSLGILSHNDKQKKVTNVVNKIQ